MEKAEVEVKGKRQIGSCLLNLSLSRNLPITLAGFFSILLDWFTHIGHSPKGARCSNSRALPKIPFHPYQKM